MTETRRCEWGPCGQWFVPEVDTHKFCCVDHLVAAREKHEHELIQKGRDMQAADQANGAQADTDAARVKAYELGLRDGWDQGWRSCLSALITDLRRLHDDDTPNPHNPHNPHKPEQSEQPTNAAGEPVPF